MAMILERQFAQYLCICVFSLLFMKLRWMHSNPGPLPSFVSISAIETSSQVRRREFSVSVVSDFRAMSSRFALIVCALSLVL